MLSLVPLPYRIGIAAALIGLLCVSSYVLGRKHVREQMNALRQSYEVAAAQAAAREAERVRMWQGAITQAGRQYDERAKIADASFDASLDRLRNAFASVKGVRLAAPASAECPAASGPTARDILAKGEELAAILRDADKVQSALASCVAAWPR